MTKVKAQTTISPFTFHRGRAITYQDLQAVTEQWNWTREARPKSIFNLTTSPPSTETGWNSPSGKAVNTLCTVFPTIEDGNVVVLVVRAVIPQYVNELIVGARCHMDSGHAGSVVFRFYQTSGPGVSVSLNFTNATNGSEVTGTLDITSEKASSGDTTGLLLVELDKTLNATSVPGASMLNARAKERQRVLGAANPDPDWT